MQIPSHWTRALGVAVAIVSLSLCLTAQTKAPSNVLKAFDTRQATMQDLSLPQVSVAGFEVDVSLDGKQYRLILRAHDIRTADYQLIEAGKNGMKVLPKPANTTYRGVVQGHGDSVIAASLYRGQLTAIVLLKQNVPAWNIQPLTVVLQGASRTMYVMHNSRDNTVPEYRCGTQAIGQAPVDAPRSQSANAGPIYICELACDADFEEYKRHGSNTNNTAADIASVINGVNVIYRRDVEVEFLITRTIVRTSQLYRRNNYSELLSDYRAHWRSNHANVIRDVSHLFTAKSRTSGVIGVAYLNAICSKSIGYGLSFTHYTSNMNNRIGLTAHELGHNFGSGHCSGSSCYIMCPSIGGCGRNVTKFGTASINAILAHRNSRNCLHLRDAPGITSISPKTVQAFDGGQITLTGKKFTSALKVKVGGKTLTPGTTKRESFQVINDSTIRFDSPTPNSLATARVSVENSIGASNGVNLGYTATKPRKLEANAIANLGKQMKWEWGAGPRHNWFLTVSMSPATFQLLGQTWLTTSTVLLTGTLTSAGYGSLSVTVPNNSLIGLKFYSQVVTINSFLIKFGGNTNVTTTEIKL